MSLSISEESKCPTCWMDMNSERYLLGHLKDKVSHLFHHECLQDWLKRNANCPICRDPLDGNNLSTFPNPNFSWVKKAWTWVDLTKESFSSPSGVIHTIKSLLPLFCKISIAVPLLNQTAWWVHDSIFSISKGYLLGSIAVASSGVIMAAPMIYNKLKGHPMVNQAQIHKIYATAVLFPIICIGASKNDFSVTSGIIVGAGITSALIEVVNEVVSPFFDDNDLLDFVWGKTRSWLIIKQTNFDVSILIGSVAAGIFTYSALYEQHSFLRDASALAAVVLGGLSSGVLSSHAAKLFQWVRHTSHGFTIC